jgi:hypothetical protein
MLRTGSRLARAPPWPNSCTKYKIPKARRHSEVTRHRVTMMTEMSEPKAAQPRLLCKLPTVHGIVNQEIPNVSGNQAACGSACNLDVPNEREKEKEGRKDDDADPNRRPNELARTRVVHPMELPKDGCFMVDEAMHQILGERPKHRSTHRSEPPTKVQSQAATVDIVEQQSNDNDRVHKQLSVVTDLGLVLHYTQYCVPSKTLG